MLTSRLSLIGFTFNALLLLLVVNDFDCRRKIAGFGSLSSLPSLRVAALYIGVRRRDTVLLSRLVSLNEAFVDLVALSIHDAGSSLVAGLETDLPGESFNLILIEDATVLVTVLHALFLGNDREVSWDNWGALWWW